MQRLQIAALVCGMVLVSTIKASVSGTVTFDSPAQITKSSQLDTNGKPDNAGYWGTDPVTVTLPSEKIVFAPRKLGDAGTTDGSAGTTGSGLASGAFTGDTGDANLNSVLTAFAYDGNNPRVITFDGLQIGHSYEVQLFAIDDRSDSSEGDRPIRYGDKADFTGNNSKVFSQKDNDFVVGHFKADAVEVKIYEDIPQNGSFNAYVLRDVTSK